MQITVRRNQRGHVKEHYRAILLEHTLPNSRANRRAAERQVGDAADGLHAGDLMFSSAVLSIKVVDRVGEQ